MTISNENKLDLLWKRSKNVSHTSTFKEFYNEPYSRNEIIFLHQIWAESAKIPKPAPNTSAPNPNAIWNRLIEPFKSANAVQMIQDPSSDGKAWVAVKTPIMGITDENRIKNWIPEYFHPSYMISAWAGPPLSDDPTTGRIYPFDARYEWEFDHQNGILYFLNEIPDFVKQHGLYIEGWNYKGKLGDGSSADGNTGGMYGDKQLIELNYISPPLAPTDFIDFTLETGGHFILVESKVSVASTLECHAFASMDDTNPYKFIGTEGQLYDDGSYTIGGTRYYGDRFINIVNVTNPTDTKTYWRITNDSPTTTAITVIVKVLA